MTTLPVGAPPFLEGTPEAAACESRAARWRRKAAVAVELLLVAAVCAVAVTQQVRWSHAFHEAPIADCALHVANATAFAAVMDAPGHLSEKALCAWAWPDLYGSGVYVTSYLLRPLTGSSVAGLLDSLSLYICFAIIGAWLLGRASGGAAAGLAAACLVISDPRFIYASRRYWLDLPVTGMVLLTLGVLVCSEGFRKTTVGVLAGVFLGLSLLVKYTAIWFLALPFVAAFSWGLWRERPSRAALARFAMAASMAGLAIIWLSALSMRHQLFVVESATLVPPLSLQLVFGCVAVAALWATFAWYQLEGVLACGTWAASAALLIAGPWAVVNRYILGTRWSAIMLESPDTAAHWRDHLMEVFKPVPWWVAAGAALGVLVALASPRKRPVLMPVVLAVVGGTAATLVILGSANRYLTPVTALLSVLAVGVVPNIPWVAALVLVTTIILTLPFPFGGPEGKDDLSAALTLRFPHAALAYTHVDATDRELPADAISKATAGARGLAVLLLGETDTERDDFDGLYYLLTAAENRSGAPRMVELFMRSDGGVQVRDLMTFQPTRVRTLAAWHGGATPLDWRSSGVAPDCVVLSRSISQPQQLVGRLFGCDYVVVPLEMGDLALLRKSSTATAPR